MRDQQERPRDDCAGAATAPRQRRSPGEPRTGSARHFPFTNRQNFRLLRIGRSCFCSQPDVALCALLSPLESRGASVCDASHWAGMCLPRRRSDDVRAPPVAPGADNTLARRERVPRWPLDGQRLDTDRGIRCWGCRNPRARDTGELGRWRGDLGHNDSRVRVSRRRRRRRRRVEGARRVAVLGINVAMLLVGGSVTLVAQRALARRETQNAS
jgi:hypothetical protein